MTRRWEAKALTRLIAAAVCIVIGMSAVLAEILEEETWYNAAGEVVKTVKRTYTGADADRTPDWEPAWVIRERYRARHAPVRRYYAPRRFYSPWYGRYYHSRVFVHHGLHARVRSGFTGFFARAGGKSRWGFGYHAPGMSIHYRH